ncbi:MAG: spermidine synthase [Acidobacteriota bacterium]
MIPWILLATASVPGDDEELRLYQRGSEYSIRVGAYELMNNRVHASEDALASVACERLLDRARARVLIGGLGMGFTLSAVLKEVGPKSEVVIAELVPEVVEWNREIFGAVSGHPLRDLRVRVRESDVAKLLRDDEDAWDAILLDVDNGPAGLTSKTNDWLYGPHGLRAAHRALHAGGLLAVWSSGDSPAFTRRLKDAGFVAEQVRVRGRGAAGGPRYLIWVAKRSQRQE